MLIIPVTGEDHIDKTLKKYKRKVEKTSVLRQLKQRKFFVKKSVQKRVQKQKAIYIQHLREKGLANA